METKRTFLAINVEPQADIINLMEYMKRSHRMDNIKWVNPKQMHLTIFFLGDTSTAQIPAIIDRLRVCIKAFSPFKIGLKGLGVFGRPSPRVIWVGVEFPESLVRLKLAIDDILDGFGYSNDNKGFNPHLTIGRVKFLHNIDRLNAEIQQYKSKQFQEQVVKGIVLYESILRPQGSEYRVIQRFDLLGG